MKTAPLLLSLLFAARMAVALELTAVCAPADGAQTFDNPGCGLAGGTWANLEPGMATNGVNLCKNNANCTKLWSMHKFSKGYVYKDYDYYTNHIERFVGGADIPLDQNALLSVSNSLLKCRRNGGTCIPRFAYTWDGWGGAEPDDFQTILTHIAQLSAVLSQFRDVVPAVECGIIGAYGEMHTSRYADSAHQNPIIDAWLSGLPADMALLVRSPPAWMRYLETTTPAFFGGGMASMDQTVRARMGFYNDGYLGTDYDYGTWGAGGGSESWSRGEGRTFLRGQAVPYGGEFAGVTTNAFDAGVHLLDPSRFNIVAEWYDTHLSYLRTIRASGMTVTKRLSETIFHPATWAFDGMPDLSEYDGVNLRKFCEDHMGYRYVVRGVSATGRKNGATLALAVENTGFGQLLFAESHEVLLVPSASGEGRALSGPRPRQSRALPSSSTDGDSAICCPATVSAPFASIRGGDTNVVSVSFNYPTPTAPGDYDVYLRVRAPLADETASSPPRRVIRFANDGCYDASLKANYLCTVSLSDWIDLAPDGLWFAYRDASDSAFGGSWSTGTTADGQFPKRDFGIDSRIPRGRAGTVEIDMDVEISSGILDAAPGIAGLIFLADDGGDTPVPYGYTRNGWTRLHGRDFTEGESITARISLDSGTVSYEADGVALLDAAGRRHLPAGGDTRATSTLSIVGGGETRDFTGRILDSRRPTVFVLR